MTYHSEDQLAFAEIGDLDIIADIVKQVVELEDGKGADMDIPEFPILRCNEKQALESYESLLAYDFTNLIAREKWSSRQTVIDPGLKKDILIKRASTGNDASNFFHYNTRVACDSNNHPSPVRSWFDRKKRKTIESSMFYKEDHRTALTMRGYIAAQFRPSSAKALFATLNAKRIYDPCGGWGDRLAGAMATPNVEFYFCRDVNPLLFPMYNMQRDFYSRQRQPSILDKVTEVNFELRGAEIDCPKEDYFDLVFTSPPYFCTEHYQGEDSSWNKYDKFDAWLHEFLFKLLANAYDSLVDGGIMAINISDCKTKEVHKICMPSIEYCQKELHGCKVLGVMGYELAPRVGKNIEVADTNAEPILVFFKDLSGNHSTTLEQLFFRREYVSSS